MNVAIGLVLALGSTFALNWGWVEQHDAARALPPLELRRPLSSLSLLFRSRSWLIGFLTGLAGWALYVAALTVAPLSVVQAAAAGGVGLIAYFARARGATLTRGELTAVGLSLIGLLLLGISLAGTSAGAGQPAWNTLAAWLIVSAAFAAAAPAAQLTPGAGLGASAGILYAAGDVATKGAVNGGVWLVLVPVVLAAHGLAFAALQLAFQRGSALASAGVSTLLTNALPIAAGIALFHEQVPGGVLGVARVVSFAFVVAAGALLSRRQVREPAEEPRAVAAR